MSRVLDPIRLARMVSTIQTSWMGSKIATSTSASEGRWHVEIELVEPRMRRNLIRTIFVVFVAAALGGQTSLAGWLHRPRGEPARYPSNTYAPQMRHYTVVDPVVVGSPGPSKHGLTSNVPPSGQVLWRQQVDAVPAYPWGWFGARRHLQNTNHTRYYHDARDWSYRWGD